VEKAETRGENTYLLKCILTLTYFIYFLTYFIYLL